MKLEDKTKIEKELNMALRYLGLRGWTVVWEPEPSEKARGLILPDERIILISDEMPLDAFETLAHEYLELRLQAMNKAKNATINALLKALQEIYYKEKERGIDSLVPPVLERMIEKIDPLVLKMIKEHAEKTGEKEMATATLS